MKEDGKLGRNWLKESIGDKINALPVWGRSQYEDHPQEAEGVALLFCSFFAARENVATVYPSLK